MHAEEKSVNVEEKEYGAMSLWEFGLSTCPGRQGAWQVVFPKVFALPEHAAFYAAAQLPD